MRLQLPLVLALSLAGAFALSACGSDIGDSCSVDQDCDPSGRNRQCDMNQPGGYCTVFGCNFESCPDDSVCVQFFTIARTDLTCNNDLECTADDMCTIGGYCAPRTAELRYCMKSCGGNGDCRTGYECRDEALMAEHGGETLVNPSKPPNSLPKFCAPAPLPDP